ncbi:MAG TPA: hydroxymyristoyl-ACP dehydratase [Candidatus Competibacter sp.]|nr:hydroxymyristoyl-ACP dehydratase [Candidatus Competibacter sp.]
MIDKTEIESLIPHSGTMCLLDTVAAWDEQGIRCLTETHRDPANPLRWQGRLSAVHAVEYGGQAAAVHGALRARQAGQTAPPGYLAALRDLRWFADELDGVAGPLEVAARLLMGEGGQCIYAIQTSAAGRVLAEARLTIAPRPVAGESER